MNKIILSFILFALFVTGVHAYEVYARLNGEKYTVTNNDFEKAWKLNSVKISNQINNKLLVGKGTISFIGETESNEVFKHRYYFFDITTPESSLTYRLLKEKDYLDRLSTNITNFNVGQTVEFSGKVDTSTIPPNTNYIVIELYDLKSK